MVMFYLTQTLLVNLSYVAVHFMLSYVVMFMSCLLGLARPEVVPRRSCADYCLCYRVHSACSGNIDVLVILTYCRFYYTQLLAYVFVWADYARSDLLHSK